jgi:hypothetical protein
VLGALAVEYAAMKPPVSGESRPISVPFASSTVAAPLISPVRNTVRSRITSASGGVATRGRSV